MWTKAAPPVGSSNWKLRMSDGPPGVGLFAAFLFALATDFSHFGTDLPLAVIFASWRVHIHKTIQSLHRCADDRCIYYRSGSLARHAPTGPAAQSQTRDPASGSRHAQRAQRIRTHTRTPNEPRSTARVETNAMLTSKQPLVPPRSRAVGLPDARPLSRSREQASA